MRVPTSGRPVAEIAESALVDRLAGVVGGAAHRLRVGIGDDAAVWAPSPGRSLVVTADTMVEDVHFRLEWTDWQALGHKCLAVNLSDLAAMGATPRLAVVSLGLRGSERDTDVVNLYRGMRELTARYGLTIAGGDLNRSPSAISIGITVIGETSGWVSRPLLRSRIRVGDVLAVTGPVGLAAAGLRVLKGDLRLLDGRPAMVEAFNRPWPRVEQGRLLVSLGVTAAMDLSDGLASDLPKMCRASNVSARIEEVDLPVPHAVRRAFRDWLDVGLAGGEDYELLFAASPERFPRICREFVRRGIPSPRQIGRAIDPGSEDPSVILREVSGRQRVLEIEGFSHFGR